MLGTPRERVSHSPRHLQTMGCTNSTSEEETHYETIPLATCEGRRRMSVESDDSNGIASRKASSTSTSSGVSWRRKPVPEKANSKKKSNKFLVSLLPRHKFEPLQLRPRSNNCVIAVEESVSDANPKSAGLPSVCENECPVCISRFGEDMLITLPCFHVFHEECALPWLKQHLTCPECRTKICADEVVWAISSES